LGDDFDVVAGNIRIGFDWQVVEGDDAPGHEEDGRSENEDSIVQREIDEFANHSDSAVGSVFQE